MRTPIGLPDMQGASKIVESSSIGKPRREEMLERVYAKPAFLGADSTNLGAPIHPRSGGKDAGQVIKRRSRTWSRSLSVVGLSAGPSSSPLTSRVAL